MNTTSIDAARVELMLADLRLPAIKLMWQKLAAQADKEGWPAARFLAALAEHELAERDRRRFERHLAEARLVELIEAVGNEHVILIAEGEAKVDLLHAWNVPATCCAGGAEKWRPEHSAFLAGADVVVLPDNDDAGRRHADGVAEALQGIAASVKVLELPGLPSKGDIIDWAAAGGSVEQLHELIEHEAKPWVPGTAKGNPPDLPAPHSLPDSLLPVDPFDFDLLPDQLRPCVADVCERMQCPPDYVAVSLMAALGSMIGRKVAIRPQSHDDWQIICNQWALLIGRPGVLKSPAMEESLRPVRKLAAKAEESLKKERAAYEVTAAAAKLRRDENLKQAAKILRTTSRHR